MAQTSINFVKCKHVFSAYENFEEMKFKFEQKFFKTCCNSCSREISYRAYLKILWAGCFKIMLCKNCKGTSSKCMYFCQWSLHHFFSKALKRSIIIFSYFGIRCHSGSATAQNSKAFFLDGTASSDSKAESCRGVMSPNLTTEEPRERETTLLSCNIRQ